jgi:hypothetical protein
MNYDCTADVIKHQKLVAKWIEWFTTELWQRASVHDASKLQEPEKSLIDHWKPILDSHKFGSLEYDATLKEMGRAAELHWKNNRHHKEHWANGIDDMTLIDFIECVADWLAVNDERGTPLPLGLLSRRFNISEQLVNIVTNTVREIDAQRKEAGMSRLEPI